MRIFVEYLTNKSSERDPIYIDLKRRQRNLRVYRAAVKRGEAPRTGRCYVCNYLFKRGMKLIFTDPKDPLNSGLWLCPEHAPRYKDYRQRWKKEKTVEKKKSRRPEVLPQYAVVVQEMRLQAGLRRKELADRAGVSCSSITRIEDGMMGPKSREAIVKVAACLGITMHDLGLDPKKENIIKNMRPGFYSWGPGKIQAEPDQDYPEPKTDEPKVQPGFDIDSEPETHRKKSDWYKDIIREQKEEIKRIRRSRETGDRSGIKPDDNGMEKER